MSENAVNRGFRRLGYTTNQTTAHGFRQWRRHYSTTIFGASGQCSAAERKAFGVLDLGLGLEGKTWSVTAFSNTRSTANI